MTPEIKFRGKSTDTYEGEVLVNEGDWVYGNLIIDGTQAYIVNGVIECNEEYISLEDWCPVDIETVGQYTGLLDKNGVEIFEGDILGDVIHREVSDIRHIVTFGGKDKLAAFILDDAWSPLNEHDCSTLYSVIGNIYENPEPLEEK